MTSPRGTVLIPAQPASDEKAGPSSRQLRSDCHVMKLMFCGIYNLILMVSAPDALLSLLCFTQIFFLITKETGQYVKAH